MERTDDVQAGGEVAELYLDLLARVLLRNGFNEPLPPAQPFGGKLGSFPDKLLDSALRRAKVRIVRAPSRDPGLREIGKDLPTDAETMIGSKRLSNLRLCIRTAISEGVEGDLIETGVWRGGATIFMRGALAAYGDTRRKVWVADSFAGLPPPSPDRYPADRGDRHHLRDELAISLDQVKENFRRYGLLDDRVEFLAGWFEDTLPTAPIQRLAVLRLDGDMYSSTIQALDALYKKVSPGGFVIIDDYGAVRACKRAVEDFRSQHGIEEPLEEIDWTGVFWRRRE